jgi:predicted RND superfamily exporter protein
MAPSEDIPKEVRYADAHYALEQIRSGKAIGYEWRLQFRSAIERGFGRLGAFVSYYPWIMMLVVVVVTCGLSLGLLEAEFETEANELWVDQSGRLGDEKDYTESVLGKGSESTVEVAIQVGRDGKSAITQKALLEHLEVVKRAARVASAEYRGQK